MANEMTLRALKAIADPTRLEIVELLSKACCGETASGDEPTAGDVCCTVTGAARITSTVSHHLHTLEQAGLLAIERRGKTCICKLRPEGLNQLADFLRSLAQGAQENECC